eukprot:TRINITY_DN14939_c0_g1_i1.p1 TRINITY_DN14939_c0_g1~~TRINITY_DN14939_c0_g1_i1.p1  ORF type:complete len:126 (-),score=12.74 TRINITY_DN14939_c0_g1_i1:236-613(-)
MVGILNYRDVLCDYLLRRGGWDPQRDHRWVSVMFEKGLHVKLEQHINWDKQVVFNFRHASKQTRGRAVAAIVAMEIGFEAPVLTLHIGMLLGKVLLYQEMLSKAPKELNDPQDKSDFMTFKDFPR